VEDASEATETRAERPLQRRAASAPAPTGQDPHRTLRHGELRRLRQLTFINILVAAAVAIWLPFLGGDPVARWVLAAMLPMAAAGALWLRKVTASVSLYASEWKVLIGWAPILLAIGAGIVYAGPYSPTPMLLVIVVYFVGLSHDRLVAFTVFGVAAGMVVIHGSLLLAGAIGDPGLVSARSLPWLHRAALFGLTVASLVVTVVVARVSRSATRESVVELDRAVRVAAQREALLQEARAELDRALAVGGSGRFTDQVLGSYRLGEVIGRGGMGEVYRGTHVSGGPAAAVKVLRAGNPDENRAVRFLREAELTAGLDASNVVRVLEFGDGREGLPYIAMELLVGVDLATVLRDRPRLPPHEVCELVAQIATGVDAAARAGIIHRDLKPRNLFHHQPEYGAPIWKILDFGMARLADDDGNLTRGNIVGTPSYMAPEQAQGGAVGPAVDIYALGAVAFRALTGEPPFRGTDMGTILYRVIHTEPPRASKLATLPTAVDAVFARALSKSPSERPSSATELAIALADALGYEAHTVTAAAPMGPPQSRRA
jgi:serine/threonine-protein kinase